MTNTERLIADLAHAKQHGSSCVDFYVGKYTGNGTSVVAALRRRGFVVTKNRANGFYRLSSAA